MPDTKYTEGIDYYITDSNLVGLGIDLGYDNTKSGLEATNVQDAIDEVNESLDSLLLKRRVTTTGGSGATSAVINFTVEQIDGYEPFLFMYNQNNSTGDIMCSKPIVPMVSNATTVSTTMYHIKNLSFTDVTFYGIILYARTGVVGS